MMSLQFRKRQYLYLDTSKSSKLTSTNTVKPEVGVAQVCEAPCFRKGVAKP
jgi:hypothetical protein